MDSDSKNVDDDGDSATKHVLDYYKKYSQNKELPKYFSGTSVSYLPEIKDYVENQEVTVKTDIEILISEANEEIVNEEPIDTSRASSVMSNRKLEWDNGADIGYDNCFDIKRLRKSSSLPVLTNLKQKKVEFDLQGLVSNMEHDSQSSGESNVKIVLLTNSSSSECQSLEIDNVYTSSSSEQPEEKPIASSSSSNIESNALSKDIGATGSSSDSSGKQRISQFANTLLYLKKKIGTPDAQSTPKYPEGKKSDPELLAGTPIVKKEEAFTWRKVKDKPSTSKSEEVLPLAVKFADEQTKSIKSKASSLENLPAGDSKKAEIYIQDKNNDVKYRKIVNLAVTKPMTVECVDTGLERKQSDQPTQTATTYTTIGVQTDNISERELIKTIYSTERAGKNQSLLFFEYSESDKSNTCSTQTRSDIVASNCDSFEFFKNSPEDKNDVQNIGTEVDNHYDNQNLPPTQPVGEIELTVIVQSQAGNLKRSQKSEDLRTVQSDEISQESSKEFCLGNVISTSHLDNIGDDIEKSIHLLQKLLKSKKYDPVTKKRYIKKIVKKITESKYLEESSTSSDLFFPKKSKSSDLVLPAELPTLMNTDTSDEKFQEAKSRELDLPLDLPGSSSDTIGDKVSKNALQSNLPWCPVVNERVKLSPKRKKLAFKTFTQDFLPKQNESSRDDVSSPPEIIPTDSRDTKKNRFTLTNNEFSVNHKSDDTPIKSSCETDNTSLEKQYELQSSSKSISYENWREDKTLSEKLLEAASIGNGNGDCLVQFAERERKYQINWINNEISHLGKLKGLLEKPEIGFSKPSKVPQNVKKTTTVYTVSEESDDTNKKEKKSKRNYVIETQICGQTSNDMYYKLGDTKYTVQKFDAKQPTQLKKTRRVLGDINVVTGGSTTNIKVTAFCETCKRAPCICGLSKSKICQVCKSGPCICRSSFARKTSNSGSEKDNICRKCKKLSNHTTHTLSTQSMLSGKTICLDCHRTTCICSKTESDPSTASRKCSKHERSPSTRKEMLSASPSDEYAGTFIPAIRPKSFVGAEGKKFYTFPYTAKEKIVKTLDPIVLSGCSVCGKNPCECLKRDIAVSAITSSILPYQNPAEAQSGSLRKVFENCSCTTQMAYSKCHCDFVQKLINHFDIAEIPSSILKDLNYQDSKNLQTEEDKPKSDCQNVGIQVQMEIKHQNLQTANVMCDVQNKVSQTDDCLARRGHRGVQTQANTRNQFSQRSSSNLGQNTISQYSQHDKVLIEYNETQTEPVKYSSGEESNKKDACYADKSTGRSARQLEGPKISGNEAVLTYICGSTQIDSDLVQSYSSRLSSSSRSSKYNSATKRGIKYAHYTLTDSIPVIEEKVDISSSANKTEQNQSKTDSLTSNLRYQMSSKTSSVVASSGNNESDGQTESESITEVTTSKPPTLIICVCCKEKHVPEDISMQGTVNQNYPLCHHCVKRRPILTSHCYAGPNHVCTCYKPVRANILQEIKKTVNELHNLEHCTCIIKSGQARSPSGPYCTHCQFKLGQTAKSKKGIAYTLTLENETPRKSKSKRKKKKPPLEEIRIKVPSYNKKKFKDKENFIRKDSAKEKSYVERSTETALIDNSSKDNRKNMASKTHRNRSLTLQEYLRKNRPEFIDTAEYRRQTLLTSRSEREVSKEEVKLRFLEQNMHNNRLKKRKLFTEQEMKEITKRNYKRLPEVREKVNDLREQKLRNADKCIADIFTRKIQGSVLKGKRTFPIDRNVIILPKT